MTVIHTSIVASEAASCTREFCDDAMFVDAVIHYFLSAAVDARRTVERCARVPSRNASVRHLVGVCACVCVCERVTGLEVFDAGAR